MNRSLPLISSLLLATSLTASARIFVPASPSTLATRSAAINTHSAAANNATPQLVAPYDALPKLDATLSMLAKSYQQVAQIRATRGAAALDAADVQQPTPNGTFNLLNSVAFNVQTRDGMSQIVAEHVKKIGGIAHVVTEEFLGVELPVSQLEALSQHPDVIEMALPLRAQPHLKEARRMSHVDEVHAAKDLYMPFKGKGVLIGVIDQSFEFRHAAFNDKDGNSRVKYLWDRSGYSTNAAEDKSKKATAKIPVGTDLVDHGAQGHGTHTANIAAGSDVGNGYYGVAPEADLILIPSTFMDKEVLEDARFVRSVAKNHGQPWVINMSFGGQEGPHDGTTAHDQNMSKIGNKEGGILVASAGNNGDDLMHIERNIAAGDSSFILFDYEGYDKLSDGEKEENYLQFDLWAQSRDDKDRIEVRPFVFVNNKVEYMDEAYWKEHGWFATSRSVYTKKYNHKFWIKLPKMRKEKNDATVLFGLKLTNTDKQVAEHVHGWVMLKGKYVKKAIPKVPAAKVLKGDNNNSVAEAAGNIPVAITVGAYSSNNKHHNAITNGNYTFNNLHLGQRSYFSSIGPGLLADVKKPTVLGPGAMVTSAMNKLYPGFDDKFWLLAEKVNINGEDYYYASEQGTSQSAPYVAGVIALWLQANPKLDYKAITEIIDKTSTKLHTGAANNWTKQEGYGRIDAYKGLKMALQKANIDPLTSIERVSSSAQPVTMQGDGRVWNVLFNNPERNATLSIVALDGRIVEQRHLEQVAQAHEETFDLSALTPGIYLIRVSTPGAQITHRVVRR